MPPKPDPAGDGEGPDPALEEEKELVERELVISHLYSRLAKYQARGLSLANLNVELIDELETQKVNLADINAYLTNDLRAKELAVGEMEQRVARLAKELDDVRDLGETRLRGVEEEAREQQHHLRVELEGFESEAKELEEFAVKRDGLDAELTDKEHLLELQRVSHKEKLDEIAQKSADEKDRLKKELALRIKDTKANMKKMTDAQLEMTTKRTIIENEQMGSELVYQARQTEKLLDRNEALAVEHHRMAGELEEARAAEQELAKRNHVYQKTIKTLTAKLAAQEEAVRYDEAAIGRGEGELKVLTQRLHAVQRERDDLVNQCDAVIADRDEAANEARNGLAARAECARFLEACAQDVDNKVKAARIAHRTSSEVEILVQPSRLEELSLVQRRRALDYLLDKINGVPGPVFAGLNVGELLPRGSHPGLQGGGRDRRGGVGGADSGVGGGVLPPIRSSGAGSFTGGIAGGPSGQSRDGLDGSTSAETSVLGSSFFNAFAPVMRDGGMGPGGRLKDDGFGPEKVDAAVQTKPSADQPAMWQEAAAADALHQTWSEAAVPPRARLRKLDSAGSDTSITRNSRGLVTIGGEHSFARSSMKHSYNFSAPRRK